MPTRPRVLFVISTLNRVGPTNVLYNLVKFLVQESFTCAVLTLSPEKKESRLAEFTSLGIPVFQLNQSRLFWIFATKKFRKVTEAFKPDILHSHSLRADYDVFRFRGSVLKLATIHADFKFNYCDTYGVILGNLLASFNIKLLQKFDWVVSCSKQLHLHYNGYLSRSYIFNGIDGDIYKPSDQLDLNHIKISLNIPLDKIIFLFVGSFIERKDPEVIIKAFLSLKSKHESNLIMVGDGPCFKSLKERYRDHKEILFRKFTHGISDYYKVSNVLVSASKSEGLPNVVLEALGCGNYVVLSEIPAHVDIIENVKCAYAFFKVGDHITLARLMDKSLEFVKSGQQINGNLELGCFSAVDMARKYGELYIHLIDEKSSTAEIRKAR